ncbi:MAG: prenyltransferase/squalene oxidase repeat-containing protein [Verrucomicrobiota bacterium]
MKTSALLAVFSFSLGNSLFAQEGERIDPAAHISLKNEIERAISRGLDFLETKQRETGAFEDEDFPALTALPVAAFLLDPSRDPSAPPPERIEKAFTFLLSKRQHDGGIYGKGLGTYNTSLSMNALMLDGRPEFDEPIEQARRFLVGVQADYGVKGETDNPFDGGIGYGGTYSHSDMSNSHFALEALYYHKRLYAERPDAPDDGGIDLDWDAAIRFIERSQNRPESNDQPWATDDEKHKGGFVYFPGKSQAGEEELPDGRVALRSYGSMSYSGLLSYIYADIRPGDPRVDAVLDWLRKNYVIEENPGMGAEGLYYYYHTMSKALTIAGINQLELADGTKVDWREDLSKQLFNVQRPDGSWFNDNGRWWEKDPVLVTSYCILALSRIHESF